MLHCCVVDVVLVEEVLVDIVELVDEVVVEVVVVVGTTEMSTIGVYSPNHSTVSCTIRHWKA